MKKLLTKYFSLLQSKICIFQEQKRSLGGVQQQNINIYLACQSDLNALKNEILQRAANDFTAFEVITDFLQRLNPRQLSEHSIDLMTVWLRRLVANYHIMHAASRLSEKDFELHMLDTSLYDQSPDIWLTHPDFIRVVKADGGFARQTHSNKITRTLFIRDEAQLKESREFITKTVECQVKEGLTIFVARADLVRRVDECLVRDLFLIPKYAVCDIEKPFWKHVLSTDSRTVQKFAEIVKTVHKLESIVKVDQRNIYKFPILLSELETK